MLAVIQLCLLGANDNERNAYLIDCPSSREADENDWLSAMGPVLILQAHNAPSTDGNELTFPSNNQL